jgi:DNA-binding beta-propeller fold protein YncE
MDKTRLAMGIMVSLLGGCHQATPPPTATAQAITSDPERSFTEFESGQVRPLALSGGGDYLYAVNTPDNRLEIFRVKPQGLNLVGEVGVGLEPVAVALRGNQVWVVNHLSDSISIVDLGVNGTGARVVRTLYVGDEPRDIVFAGTNRNRAFITTAHRGQNIGFDPQVTTAGVGRADVWVFDAENLGSTLGGTPLTVVTLFTDTPRALAVTPDGSRVYAAGFHTGNQTTTVNGLLVNAPGGPGKAPPFANHQGQQQPGTGLIVKWNGTDWVDERGGPANGGPSFNDMVKFSLPDKDVFSIDANANPPQQLDFYQHVGTVLFNLIVNPANGKVYSSNLDSKNEVRFEGPGITAGHRGVQGHLAESRITVLDPAQHTVTSRHLNKHIDYSQCCAALPNDENARSLAFPTGMAITNNGTTLYVAALGSKKVGVYSTAALENNTFVPNTADQIALTGGGPTGLALDEGRGKLYVMTRFDNSISTIDTASKTETAHVALYNPEPPSITTGRRYLYDAAFTSSHGDSACASCHIFGDFDSLAWDLGNPDGDMLHNPGPFDDDVSPVFFVGGTIDHHPMKGPMSTQSLRGMSNHGPMHWRGDRTGGNDAPTFQPDSGAYDEHAAFMKFNPAFVGLVGRATPIDDSAMSEFADFMLQVAYPPNPLRNLDDSDTDAQARGRAVFSRPNSGALALTPVRGCRDCHALDPTFNAQYGVRFPGIFGSDNNTQFVFEPELLKVPHLRNQYQKIGMFGNPDVSAAVLPGDNGFKGEQVRGFGFFHDGSVDTDFRFVSAIFFAEIDDPNSFIFNPTGIPISPEGDAQRRDLEQFMYGFPSNMAPMVGQQVTLNADTAAVAGPRLDLMEWAASHGQCELVAKARIGGSEHGALFTPAGYLPDRALAPTLSSAQLRQLAPSVGGVTYTCVPPGSGRRIGIDRDLDGILDGDE